MCRGYLKQSFMDTEGLPYILRIRWRIREGRQWCHLQLCSQEPLERSLLQKPLDKRARCDQPTGLTQIPGMPLPHVLSSFGYFNGHLSLPLVTDEEIGLSKVKSIPQGQSSLILYL